MLESLRTRKINHKFHYDSVKQTQKWLALHQIYSPSRNDENVRAIYEQSFEAAAAKIKSKSVHVIGLGCGGGQKDARLLKLLKARGKEIFYTPCDVSTRDGFGRAPNRARRFAGEKLFSIRLRFGNGE